MWNQSCFCCTMTTSPLFLLCFSISSGCFPLTGKGPAERETVEKASTGREHNCVSGCPVGTWDIWSHHSPERLSSKQLQIGRNSIHTHTHTKTHVNARCILHSSKLYKCWLHFGEHTQPESVRCVLFRRMTEAVVESADVLKPCDVTSCDIVSCPSPPPCLSPCSQREDEECHLDSKKLEQQVSDTKHSSCYVPPPLIIHHFKIMHPPLRLPLTCSFYDKLCPHLQKHCNQVQPKKKVKVS